MHRGYFRLYAYLPVLTMHFFVPVAYAQGAPANDDYADAMPIHATGTCTINDVQYAAVEGA